MDSKEKKKFWDALFKRGPDWQLDSLTSNTIRTILHILSIPFLLLFATLIDIKRGWKSQPFMVRRRQRKLKMRYKRKHKHNQ